MKKEWPSSCVIHSQQESEVRPALASCIKAALVYYSTRAAWEAKFPLAPTALPCNEIISSYAEWSQNLTQLLGTYFFFLYTWFRRAPAGWHGETIASFFTESHLNMLFGAVKKQIIYKSRGVGSEQVLQTSNKGWEKALRKVKHTVSVWCFQEVSATKRLPRDMLPLVMKV